MKTLKKITALLIAVAPVFFNACGEKEKDLVSFKLDPTTVQLSVGATANVTTTPMPSDATVDFSWTSSNPAVATVAKTGNLTATITAVANGTATIFARSGAVEKTVSVTVGSGNNGGGAGTENNPYTTETLLAAYPADTANGVWLTGYIVGYINGMVFSDATLGVPAQAETEILIGASASATTGLIPVQLPSGAVRTGLELFANPSNLGKSVKVYGDFVKYFGVAGLKNTSYYELEGGTSGGTKPKAGEFKETLGTAASFAKFTAVSVTGAQVWNVVTNYGGYTQMSGYDGGSSHANEDWLISPEINLAGQSGINISFEHARGPAPSINVGVVEGWYKVFATANYTGDVATTTWVEITGITHGTAAWGWVSSGTLPIPASAISATTRVAFKYLCSDTESATWEIRNLVVGK